MATVDNSPLETFDSISSEKFLHDFDLPLLRYSDNTVLNCNYAFRLMDSIVASGHHPDSAELYEDTFAPFVYLLYQAEVGLKNRMKYENDEPIIFAPQATEAYRFLGGRKVLVNPPETRIEEIQELRNIFLHLFPAERIEKLGFPTLSDEYFSNTRFRKALEFLKKFLIEDGSNGVIDWDRTPEIKKIYPNVLY